MSGIPDQGVQRDIWERHERRAEAEARRAQLDSLVETLSTAICKKRGRFLSSLMYQVRRGRLLTATQLAALNRALIERGMDSVVSPVREGASVKKRVDYARRARADAAAALETIQGSRPLLPPGRVAK